jgi:hypothetical protein
MKHKLFKILVCMAMLCNTLATYAYDFVTNGIYYTVVEGLQCAVAGSGGSDKYSGDVIIPSEVNRYYDNPKVDTYTVMGICSSAFSGCTELTSVSIPETVTKIGTFAFSDCTGLTSLTIDGGFFYENVFKNCTGLTSVTINDGGVRENAFYGCTNLSVTINGGSIWRNAFSDCSDCA